MYTLEKRVLFSDIDHTSKMSISGILNAMQDVINVNSESIGKGISYMMQAKRTWFAISWNIEIKRRPDMFEEILLKTWPYDFSAVMGYRNVIISDKTGNDILCADSIWSLVDMESGRPLRIEEEDAKGYDLEPKYDMKEVPRKIKQPDIFTVMEHYVVRRSDIDYNGHMSNGQYIKLVEEYTPFDKEIRRIRVEYKKQAKYQEPLLVKRAVEGFLDADGKERERYVFIISSENQKDLKAIVEIVYD